MGFLKWLTGSKPEPRLSRGKIVDLIRPVEGDEGYPATEAQLKELRKLACGEPPTNVTLRQASLILSARDYSRVLLDHSLKRRVGQDSYYDLQSSVIAYIVGEDEIAAAVQKWGRRNYDADEWKAPRKDEHWRRILTFIGPAVGRIGGR